MLDEIHRLLGLVVDILFRFSIFSHRCYSFLNDETSPEVRTSMRVYLKKRQGVKELLSVQKDIKRKATKLTQH